MSKKMEINAVLLDEQIKMTVNCLILEIGVTSYTLELFNLFSKPK